ncbi:uncharacterized protein LOC143210725 [Lasioglossum baleicum]|uniref:uncharacterized protein LOC143210725 n=1 Tax=Lasioglossum baleicum TaxID=434251 RepID=UPI003FCE143C
MSDPVKNVSGQTLASPMENLSNQPPTSEVGFERNTSENDGTNWKLMFEMLLGRMQGPIVQQPVSTKARIFFPEFDPDNADHSAKAWCRTVDVCLAERPIQGGELIMALSRALKGSASAWMTQVNYAGMDWGAFRKMFLAQYDTFETPAGATMRINGGKPREGESMPSYANRVLASFTSLYTKMSTEQIAIASTLAHCVQIDPRLQRVAVTTKIDNRASLQKELMAFGFRKRSATADGRDPKATDIKKMRSGVACFSCGKEGHKATDCRRRQGATRMLGPHPGTSGGKCGPPQKPVTCFKCGEDGHIAPQCKKEDGRSHPRVSTERRINLCSIAPVTAELAESGEVEDFCFDTGAERSLIKEPVANKFSGKRFENLTRLISLGNAKVMSSVQILSQVITLDHSVEILFHVVPGEHLNSSILIGRDLIAQGLSVETSANNFILKRDKMIKICEVSKKIDNFNSIDTDIVGPDKEALINLLNGFSESFVIGTPTGRINSGELLIKLIDPNRTVQRRPYRLSPNERQTVRDKISELLSGGIIRPSCSPFASPIILEKQERWFRPFMR